MRVDAKYHRVIPRDLFNEAKLLKCIGKLCLLILDGLVPVKMSYEENGEPFQIGMTGDGYLTVTNLEIYVKNKPYRFKTNYNSKSNYTLFLEHEDNDYRVFDEDGNFDTEFLEFCKTGNKIHTS